MEFLAQEVLIEAISKLAALSHAKLFLLLEDSLSNRSYAGAESLCAAFAEGSLKRRDNDAKVDYDISERRCVKAVSQAWAREGVGAGAGGSGSGGGRGGAIGNEDSQMNQGGDLAVVGDSAEIIALESAGGDDRGAGIDQSPREGSLPRQPAASDFLAPVAEESRPKRGAIDPRSEFARNKRIKAEPKSRSRSPPTNEPSPPPLANLNVSKLQSAMQDDNLMSTLSSALKSLSHLPSTIPSSLTAAPPTALPTAGRDASPSASNAAAAASAAAAALSSSASLFPAPRDSPASRLAEAARSPRARDGRSPRLGEAAFGGGGGAGGGGGGGGGDVEDRRIDDLSLQSSTVSLFPDSAPTPTAPSSNSIPPPPSLPRRSTPSSSPSRAPASSSSLPRRSSPSSSPSRAPTSSSSSSPSRAPASAATSVSPFAANATRTIRVDGRTNYSDADSVSARFRRFGDVLHVARDKSSSGFSNWWTIEFASVRAAAEALHFVREQRGFEADFDANSEFTDWIWVAFKHPDDDVVENSKDGAGLNRAASSFLKTQFGIFGTILRTSGVKFAEDVKEISCVVQFRSSKHVEMIIKKVRGQQLNGTRFQLDVASPMLKDRYFESDASTVGSSSSGGGDGSDGSSSASGSEKAGRSNGSRSKEPKLPPPQQTKPQQPDTGTSNDAEQQQQPLYSRRREVDDRPEVAAASVSSASSSNPAASSQKAASPEQQRHRQSPIVYEEKSRTIQLVLSEKQLSILRQCPVEKLVSLFSSYGDVVEVFMPSEANPSFAVEFLDVESAKKAVIAGRASSGAFKAVFDLDGGVGGAAPIDSVWMGALDMPPKSSGTTASTIRRELLDKFADFDDRPKSIWISRSKSQSVIRFSSPAVAKRVLAALREERRGGKGQKQIEFDGISMKAVKMFIDKMSEEDKIENQKSK